MKFTYALLLMLMSGTLFLSSCGDDEVDPNEALNNRLEGQWEVSSFLGRSTIGVEFMGSLYSNYEMEFEKQGPDEGEYEFTRFYVDGTSDRIEGDYEIENNGTELVLMPTNADLQDEEYDIEIDGDDLELDGVFQVDGSSVRVIVEAERD